MLDLYDEFAALIGALEAARVVPVPPVHGPKAKP